MGGKVLIVSDDSETGQIWAHAVGQRGLEAAVVCSPDGALSHYAIEGFDLTVVDVHTPRLDGIDLCRRLRAEAVNPILLLTPRSDEAHVLEAYKAGVDECIVKPIGPALFLAKVTAWLRRAWTIPAEAIEPLQVNGFRLDPTRREVITTGGCAVKLTNLEFRLLHLLRTHRGQVLQADVIVDRVWGYSGGGDNVLLKNLAYRLRRKIEPDPAHPRYIQTVAGEGYTFEPRAIAATA